MRVRYTRTSSEMQILHKVISKRMKLANNSSFECEIKDLLLPSVLCVNMQLKMGVIKVKECIFLKQHTLNLLERE